MAIYANSLPETILRSSVITLDNIGTDNFKVIIGFVNGGHFEIPSEDVHFLIIGNVQSGGAHYGMYTVGVETAHPSMLDESVPGWARRLYYSKARPQYGRSSFANTDISALLTDANVTTLQESSLQIILLTSKTMVSRVMEKPTTPLLYKLS